MSVSRDLVLRAQGGDHAAFEHLAASMATRLYGTATLILRDPDAARDAVQDTLIEAWRGLPVLRNADAFEGWTYILVRTCRRQAQHAAHRLVDLGDLSDDLATPSAEGQVDDRDRIGRAFGRLSREHRLVLVLHHHLGLPVAEVAAALGVPPGTVKSRLNRASAAFRAALEAAERWERTA